MPDGICARCGGPKPLPSVKWCAACTEILYRAIHPEHACCDIADPLATHDD